MIDVHHDFETACELDIGEVGLYRYTSHPSARVLMLSWAVQNETPRLWVPAEGEPMPEDLLALIANPEVRWHAFNAQFERRVWWDILGVHLPTQQFYCTMQHAWYLSFSGGLAEVGEQLGLRADKRKQADGKKLIHKFCKPAPKNHKADWYTHENAPEDWARFKQYCVQDVVAEREIEMLLAGYPVPARERELWLWDQDVNDRGVPIDRALVDRAVELERTAKAEMREELENITWLENPNSGQQFHQWLQERGIVLPNLQKETVQQAIKDTQDPLIRRALECKLVVGKVSTTKWQAFQRATQEDGLLRGMFQFGGAQRTQRWAGRTVQLHNLKSPRIPFPDLAADSMFEDPDTIRFMYGDLLSLLSETIRCAITAPPGYVLTPCDLSSIESRWLGYMSGCVRINSTFAEGRDTYKDFATEYYGVAYEDVTKAMRTFSKPPVLGCFAEDTLVLTKRGWVPIIDIQIRDELWDGEQWVPHDGIIPQGLKQTTLHHGVRATLDHRILTVRGWKPWSALHGENIHLATSLARGTLSSSTVATGYAYVDAAAGSGSTRLILTGENPYHASCVQTDAWLGSGRLLPPSGSVSKITTGSRGGITPSGPDARILRTPNTGVTERGAYAALLQHQKKLFGILSRFPVGIIQISKSIGSIITAITRLATFVSSTVRETLQTLGSTLGWSTLVGNLQQVNFTENSPLGTEVREPSDGKSQRGSLLNKLSTNNETAEVLTYDLLNAGPNSRFTIWTDAGPVIAHNCGYQLGRKGLIEYAAGYGVEMAEEDARRAVDTWREINREVPPMWKWLVEACKETIESGQVFEGYTVRIRRDDNFLMIDLPSGRTLHYYQPLVLLQVPPWERERIEEGEIEEHEAKKVPTVTYMSRPRVGKGWVRLSTHGGKITENLSQACCRDILGGHMMQIDREFCNIIRGHVHDEAIPMVPEARAEEVLKGMEQIMSVPPDWAPTLLLGAEGFITKRYKKE